jgi:hypothetical protein
MYVSLRLDELRMTKSAYSKWSKLPTEDKAFLNFCFSQAMARPIEVGEYNCEVIEISGEEFELHKFRIGYADFHIAVGDKLSPIILVDMNFEISVDLDIMPVT